MLVLFHLMFSLSVSAGAKTVECQDGFASISKANLARLVQQDPSKFEQQLKEIGYDNAKQIVETFPETAARIALNKWDYPNITFPDNNARVIKINKSTLVKAEDVLDAEALEKHREALERAPVTVVRGISVDHPAALMTQIPTDKHLPPTGMSTRDGIFFTDSPPYAERYADPGYLVYYDVPLAFLHYGGEKGANILEMVVAGQRFKRRSSKKELLKIMKHAGEDTFLFEGNSASYETSVLDFRPFISVIKDNTTGEMYELDEFLQKFPDAKPFEQNEYMQDILNKN